MKESAVLSNKLRAMNPDAVPAQANELGYYDFWYYTRLSTADKIMDSSSFWVSNISDMNDLDELKLHESEKDRVFALCFCNSDTEKIPMWYLYSGIAGKGASLGLTPLKMLRFLESLRFVDGETVSGDRRRLAVGSDVDLRFGWVYYQKQKQPDQIKYRSKWYTIENPNDFVDRNYFLKAYPWEYEKEFRLVFINRRRTVFKRLIVQIPTEVRDGVKIRLAPELKEKELDVAASLQYIGKQGKKKLLYSELSIKMGLFHRNRDSLPDYLRETFLQDVPDIKPQELCLLIRGAKYCDQMPGK